MGTNYYLHKTACRCCGHKPEPIHIGKSSAGWCFMLHVIPGEIEGLSDWLRLMMEANTIIVDEYNAIISPEEMRKIIMERTPWSTIIDEPCFDKKVRLLRSEGSHVKKHGSGTYDYIIGDFS